MADHEVMSPIRTFPLDAANQSAGRFWAAGPAKSEQPSDGFCRVSEGAIEVAVVKPLTPSTVPLDAAIQGITVPATEELDWVVHGTLPIRPRSVTFLGVRTVERRSGLFSGESDAPELHRMQADLCVAGAHIEAHTTYDKVRARFTHLELWAGLGGVTMTMETKPATRAMFALEPHKSLEVPFDPSEPEARMRLSASGTFGTPDVWGVQVATVNWLELDGLAGWTLEKLFANFVVPVQVLLTLLAGEQCEATHIEVMVDGTWCPLYGMGVHSEAPRPSGERLLLNRETMPLDTVALWCTAVTRLSPAPHIVASSVAGTMGTVPSEARALTTAAEGLDRALFPDSRRFTQEEVNASITALKASTVPEAVRQQLISALNLYFYEDSYPARMKRLAAEVQEAAPGCIGFAHKWADEMRDLRVGLAHGLDQETASTDDALLQMHARTVSLRWALGLRLLLASGVPSETLNTALGDSQRYLQAERRWKRYMPKAHPPASAQPAG